MKNLGFKMKYFAVAAVAGVLATAASAFAASPVKATIPFRFEAGSAQLPAGTYVVERAANGHSIRLSNVDKADTVIVPVISSGTIGAEQSARLVFEQLGQTYRLSDVKIAGGIPSDSVPRSKKQALVAKEQREQIFVEVALD